MQTKTAAGAKQGQSGEASEKTVGMPVAVEGLSMILEEQCYVVALQTCSGEVPVEALFQIVAGEQVAAVVASIDY